jgi:NAD-dependent deacetylase
MDAIVAACRQALSGGGLAIALTGAGISAESGIPTFRGKEGYWTIGAREYHPQELATLHAFRAMPWDVWGWYLYRRGVCRAAAPNPAHAALVSWERALGERFALVTQNVDGLHRRAGSSRLYPIHGDLDHMRCAADCSPDRWPIPDALPALGRGEPVTDAVRARLTCPRCGGRARPHVLWFDESYDEPRYHLDTVRGLAGRSAVVVIVGTSAQTNLPWQVVTLARRAGARIVDVNVEDNPFGDLADFALRAPAATALPALVAAVSTGQTRSD